jgi:hypothetical protein
MQPTWDEIQFNFELCEDSKYVSRNERGIFSSSDVSRITSDLNKTLDFVSDDKKIIIQAHAAYFHVLTEVAPILVDEIRKADSEGRTAHFVLSVDAGGQGGPSAHVGPLYDHFAQQIVRHGHKVSLVSLNNGDELFINNFSIYRQYHSNLSLNKAISEFMLKGVVDLEKVEPTRKVYLTRSMTLPNGGFRAADDEYNTLTIRQIREKYKYKMSDRVDDEALLEEYFSGLGFEIKSPEDIESFEDQLKFMAEVKTVVSLTSASLASMFFMKPGALVVELSTPLTLKMADGVDFVSIHPHYMYLAHDFKHSYLSLSHDRVASKIVERIDGDPRLKALFVN